MSVPDDQPHTRTRYPAGEQPPEATGRRPLRTLAAVLGAVLVLVIAVAILNRTSGSPTPTAGTGGGGAVAGTSGDGGGATAPTGTQPVTTTQNGIATGFPRTREGAQSAAVNYAVALGSSDMYAAASRHTIVTTVADPSATARLLGRFDPSYTALANKLGLKDGQGQNGLTFVSRTIPVGTKTDAFSSDQSTIEVWSNSIGGLAGQGSTSPVSEYWSTLTLTLHWVSGDWKVSDFAQIDGPTPVSGSQSASSADAISNAVKSFGGFRYAR
ncbi:hypothetical protein ABIA33_000785 [Streptacidiphilus sp. MAP12-16]|uniref:hypothetical protein n=1 Tax=Streptacidiphilus sp. MAP12-16 TaxID=3156300 RepID=UPI00351688A1